MRILANRHIAVLLFSLFTLLPFQAKADEGMWTLYNLPQAVYNQMQQEGFQLPYDALYRDSNAVMRAVVQFSGYCSGVVVSPDGLVFTNHHCGFESIRSHSTVEHDYMLNGFYAKTYADELPNEDMFVAFMLRQEDVTAQLQAHGIDHMDATRRAVLIDSLEQALTSRARQQDSSTYVVVDAFYEGNKYFATTYQQFNDIRLVFAVPKSMGKFGGETDNWMWPRQTCDFSVFRIYANPKTNGPAEYSKDNVPYHPKNWARVSLDGYKDGDFAMTMGYPGSTERYLSSYGIEQMRMTNAVRAQARGVKQDVMTRHMRASEAVRIKYDSKFAQSSNYWKNSIGMNKCIDSIGLIRQKREFEHRIAAFVDSTGYLKDSLDFGVMKRLYAANSTAMHDQLLLNESFRRTNELCTRALHAASDSHKAGGIVTFDDDQQTWDAALDKEVLAVMLKNYCEQVADKANLPKFYQTIEKKYKGDYTRFVEDTWRKTVLMKNHEAIATSTKKFTKDPGVVLGRDIMAVRNRLQTQLMHQADSIATQERWLCRAKIRMEEDLPHYSDANFTMRLSYGQVCGFELGGRPSGYYTEASSIVRKMQQGDQGVIDYQAEPVMHRLMSATDFGPYLDKTTGKMQLCLLTNNDITGGNSGSPLFDGRGRLIGLAFDGNWDSLSSDINFDRRLARCISVDIRYVLYLMDSWGHAHRLLSEVLGY